MYSSAQRKTADLEPNSVEAGLKKRGWGGGEVKG